MKKLISTILVFALLIIQVPTVFADSDEWIRYDVPGTNITLWYDDSETEGNGICIMDCSIDASGDLVIPDTIDGKTVTEIAASSFSGNAKLTSVKIPASVTEIREYAFFNCSGLTEMTIPSGVTVIREGTFGSCYNLEKISFPDNLTAIEDNAFTFCTELKSVDLPDTVRQIGEESFSHTALTEFTVPKGVSNISEGLLDECTQLSHVELHDGIKSIGVYAFYNCLALKSIDLPKGLETIDEYAFWKCRGLESIIIPPDVKIREGAFEDCDSLMRVEIPESVAVIEQLAFGYRYVDKEDIVRNDFTIICHDNSAGKKYAVDNGLKYVVIPFSDDTGKGTWSWGAEGIYACVRNGIMNGVSPTVFSADQTITRAQMVVMLYRLRGQPAVEGTNPFRDLREDWYRDAVLWASTNGITSGVSSTAFDPDGAVNREQLATFLYRYLNKFSTLKPVSGDLSKYTDRGKVSAFAQEAMTYCVGAGIINGTSSVTLSPSDTATRGQTAVIFSRTFLTK